MDRDDYKEIHEEDIEILGEDGIYRKYSEYKQKRENKKIVYWIPFILALIYIISPIDAVPDRIPIGKLDDIFLLSITFFYAIKKSNFVQNSFLNMIIKNMILSATITLFVLMILIYAVAILV
ncbi:DUF1232 domain-containing protein [Brachyspira pilosicoli]|uniref:DUF1232 domain-containing protein n=1 Tax=Brachyspira pilosicoli TaxID=52584 RepID=A0A5C8ENR6_BRAPL|nr:YkvA family protein [Brachyspira pilosicoli]TXJ39446.1 DUF1232 domain-containing protein [Brachyspira pilosicoli]